MYRLWELANDEGVRLQHLAAAVLRAGRGCAISHRAAALHWRLDGFDTAPIELSATRGKRATRPGVIVHRVTELPPVDVTHRGGIRVTTVARTLLDLARVVDLSSLELAMESALRRGFIKVAGIWDVLTRAGPTVGGKRALRSLIQSHTQVPTESPLEALVYRMLIDGGSAVPVRQHEIRDEAGGFIARVDVAFPEARLAIEADGYRFHSSRREWQRDRERQNALVARGWTIYRVTWEDATKRPSTVRRAILRLLGELSKPDQ